METTQKQEPKYLSAFVCPECGSGAEVEDMQDKNEATFWHLRCSGCGLQFKQWTCLDTQPTSLEYNGQDYPLEASAETQESERLADATTDLLKACKTALAIVENPDDIPLFYAEAVEARKQIEAAIAKAKGE